MRDLTENFDQFASALRALVPLFDRAGIIWSDDGQYDEFDEVANSLFYAFVISTFSDDREYSIYYDSYRYYFEGNKFSFDVVDAKTNKRIGTFVRFVTNKAPFDSLELSSIGRVCAVEFSPLKTRIVPRVP